ncbi:MAG: o-succinylbenzoate synthase [Leptolyngbya sp.]|nr:o-succinylbenzoate synthase [Leptolyngbya sp.]
MGFEIRPYQRPFRQPLRTAHGLWAVREGLILRLVDGEGHIGYGEIAPMPWFGTETLAQALTFCQSLEPSFWQNRTTLAETDIPPHLTATQFGLASAWIGQQSARISSSAPRPAAAPLPHCALLPATDAALTAWLPLWDQGFRTFKWKIGVADISQECRWLETLMAQLPAAARLRLDANGGLTVAAAAQLLRVCDQVNGKEGRIECLEQPLPPEQFHAMQRLAQQFKTPLALDESVATLAQLEDHQRRGWTGLWVVKPAIAGWPDRLRRFWRHHAPTLLFSSVFETPIGRQAALTLAHDYAHDMPGAHTLGFGTLGWFDDHWDHLSPAQLWDHIGAAR